MTPGWCHRQESDGLAEFAGPVSKSLLRYSEPGNVPATSRRLTTAKGWLEPLIDDVPRAASDEASRALTSAKVDASELHDWKRTIQESQSGDREISESRLEGFAYVEAVRAGVRSGLAEAGFPDAPTRLIEVYSDMKCN